MAHMCWHLVLALTLLRVYASAQVVITAPDKGDELERRAYVEAQSELADTIRHRDPNATIDIDVYTYVACQSVCLCASRTGSSCACC